LRGLSVDRLHQQLWVHHYDMVEPERKLPAIIPGVGVTTHSATPDGKTIRENLRKTRLHLEKTPIYAVEQDGLIVIKNLDPEGMKPTLRQLATVVCKFYNITFAELISTSRSANMVRYREQFAYIACLHTTHSLPQIGKFLGGRDHTTILSNLRVFCDRVGVPMPRGYKFSRRSNNKGKVAA